MKNFRAIDLTPPETRAQNERAVVQVLRRWRFHFVPVSKGDVPKTHLKAAKSSFSVEAHGFKVWLHATGECWLRNRAGQWFVSTAADAVKATAAHGSKEGN